MVSVWKNLILKSDNPGQDDSLTWRKAKTFFDKKKFEAAIYVEFPTKIAKAS